MFLPRSNFQNVRSKHFGEKIAGPVSPPFEAGQEDILASCKVETTVLLLITNTRDLCDKPVGSGRVRLKEPHPRAGTKGTITAQHIKSYKELIKHLALKRS